MADKNSIVTLNVGSQRVSLSLFTAAKGGGLILHDYAFSELLGDPAADSARVPQIGVAVVELVQKLGVAKQDVRYAISGHSVFTRFVKLPALDEEKVDDIVRFEAQQNVPFPINEVAWDYQLVSSGDEGGEVEVALVAIKNDSLDEVNEAVEGGAAGRPRGGCRADGSLQRLPLQLCRGRGLLAVDRCRSPHDEFTLYRRQPRIYPQHSGRRRRRDHSDRQRVRDVFH